MFDVGGKTWKSYNWSIVTTVATFGKYDAELMCHAHSVGARVVLKGKFICVLNHNCFIFLTMDHVPNLVIFFFFFLLKVTFDLLTLWTQKTERPG